MMISNTRLAGRRAIVTGGGSGIGRAVAHRLATEGAAVGVIDVRQDATDTVTAAIVAEGGKAFSGLADVGSEQAVEAATTELAASLGGLDTVVACAGVAFPGATHSTPLEAWEAMLRVNLTGVFLTVEHALPHLLEGGGGSIATIGSVASLVAAGQSSAYDASKGGVLQFTAGGRRRIRRTGDQGQLRVPWQGESGARGEQSDRDRPGGRVGSDAPGRRPARRADVPLGRPSRDRCRGGVPLL